TRDFAVRITRIEASGSVTLDDDTLPWREAPARWALLGDVPRRHALEEAWRGVLRDELNLILERWHEALRAALVPLGSDDWLAFWSGLLGIDASDIDRIAQAFLDQTDEVYGNSLGVYLGQLDLPIDDVWISDVDWAFRALRFDATF